nr:MAG TPA: hypothetical protein [Caudoviricetes sp.]
MALVPQFPRPIDTGSGTAAGRGAGQLAPVGIPPEGDGETAQAPQGVA